jgi:hypothetical protein
MGGGWYLVSANRTANLASNAPEAQPAHFAGSNTC